MSETTKSLALMLEEAKCEMTAAINQVIQNTNLPAYLIDGILSAILADVRSQKNIELVEEMKTVTTNSQKEKCKEGE